MSSVAFGPDNNLYAAWVGASPVLTTSGTDAPSFVQRFGGPLTPAVSTTLPVTILKTYQKTYSNTKSTPIADLSSITSTIAVPDSGQIVDVNVKLNITEKKDSDLIGSLTGPAGVGGLLFYAVGGSGSNFTNTVLDDEAPGGTFIDTATAPFKGTFRPSGDLSWSLDGGQAKGTWTLGLSDQVKGGKGTLNNWSITVTYGIGPAALSASSEGTNTTAPALTDAQVQPLVQEAAARWQAAGLSPQQEAILQGVHVQIANLGGTTLGMASGNTIFLDDNAAGWGWFVDATPGDDSEFTTPGDQGEQGHMDLLTVLTHEMGHLLGLEHSSTAGDVMDATLNPGVRLMPAASDLLGSTLAGTPLSGSKDAGKTQPALGRRKDTAPLGIDRCGVRRTGPAGGPRTQGVIGG